MEKYDELLESLNEKQKLLDEALGDLAKGTDCQYCANVSLCSSHRIERNFAYGGCVNWQWRGTKMVNKAS